ncbi:MAG: HEPN domain-containing protein [Desulfuromonadales bacterium]|nr:HEPN domain-containing protein [Desulfuromonadales bacterium]
MDEAKSHELRQWLIKAHHDLRSVRQLLAAEPRFTELSEAAEFLTPFATSFRYPGDVLEPMQDDVETGLKLAEQIVGFVLVLMPDTIGQDLRIVS